jgi:hypothetical protein
MAVHEVPVRGEGVWFEPVQDRPQVLGFVVGGGAAQPGLVECAHLVLEVLGDLGVLVLDVVHLVGDHVEPLHRGERGQHVGDP